MSPPPKRTVVVTGFGPFGKHTVNASWEAVKLLPQMLDTDMLNVTLVTEEIPVVYDETLKRLQQLYEEHHPILIINVGVSHKAKELTLESCAAKKGYCRPDVEGKLPEQNECCIGGDCSANTVLNVERLAADLNKAGIGVTCCTSTEAGLYLCEFSYYTSLSLNGKYSLFVHVPDIGTPYQPEETARGLCEIIRLALAQLIEDGATPEVEENEL